MSTAIATKKPVSLSAPSGPMELIREALMSEGSPLEKAAIVKELVALQQSVERFQWEREERQGKIDFDEALNRCQSKVERISADANNPQTHSRYATYAKLDRVLRPIYTAEGFSLSFGEEDCPTPGKTRFVASLSRSGITREFRKDMTASTKGPKGNDVMTPVHAEGALDSYARRYLLKSIFNVAVGEDDTDGSVVEISDNDSAKLDDWADALRQCPDLNSLRTVFADAYKFAKPLGSGPKEKMTSVYEECKRRLQ